MAVTDLQCLLPTGFIVDAGVNHIVGPAMGALALSAVHAMHISSVHGVDCSWSYTVKCLDGQGKDAMKFDRTSRPMPEDRTLCVEDTVTTGGSVERAIKAVSETGTTIAPFVLALMNRSGQSRVEHGNYRILSLITEHMPTWDPNKGEACPLCELGSKAIHAKGPEEWSQLNADYD